MCFLRQNKIHSTVIFLFMSVVLTSAAHSMTLLERLADSDKQLSNIPDFQYIVTVVPGPDNNNAKASLNLGVSGKFNYLLTLDFTHKFPHSPPLVTAADVNGNSHTEFNNRMNNLFATEWTPALMRIQTLFLQIHSELDAYLTRDVQ